MRIIAKKTLIDYIEKNKQSENVLLAWYHEAYKAKWNNFHDMKKDYPHASILKNNYVVFNIGGNKYRLIVSIFFKGKIIYIKFIGTHAEYNKFNKTLSSI